MNRNKAEQDLKADQFEEDYRSLEQRSLEIWLVLQLLDGNFTGNCFWHELEAIPQARFSLLKNLPSIVTLVRESLNAPSRYLNQRGTLFSVKQKAFVNCSVSAEVSPLKSRVLAEVFTYGDEQQDIALSYSTIIELFKEKLFQQIGVLRENAESQSTAIADFCDGLSRGNSLSARMQAVSEQYAHLIEFSSDPSGVDIPFSSERVFENILTLFADREALLLELQQDHGGVYSCTFFNTFFSQAHYIFHPYFEILSDEQYTQWKSTEINFMLIDLRYRLGLSSNNTVDSMLLHLEEGNIDDLSERFYAFFDDLNSIVENNESAQEALSRLQPIIVKLEQVYCADVVFSEWVGRDLGAYIKNSEEEPKTKMRKTIVCDRTQGDKHTVKYLCDFANALYVFITRVHLPLYDNLSNDTADFMMWHDSEYAKVRQSMAWVRRWVTGLSGYDALVSSKSDAEQACHQRFLRVAKRFGEASSARIHVLASSRIRLQQSLLKGLHSFADSFNTQLNQGLGELKQLSSPSWVEWDSKAANLSCYAKVINNGQYYFVIINQFLRSVKLTNDQANFDTGYPRVSDQLISTLETDLIGLSTMRNAVAKEYYRGILHWFEKIKSTVDAGEHSLQDVVSKFYLLGLYHYHRPNVLENLARLTQAGHWDEIVALGEAISQFEPDRCAKAILQMQTSLPLTELVERLVARYLSFQKIRGELPSVFNLLVRYLIVQDSSGRAKLFQDSLHANKVIAQFFEENQSLNDELILLNDFTAMLPQDSPIISQIDLFNKFNQTVEEYQNAVANLVYLSGQSSPRFEGHCNEPESVLATTVQGTWAVMTTADTVLNDVIRSIQSGSNNEIVDRTGGWRTTLQQQCETCSQKIGELKSLFGLEGVVVDALSRCKPELRNVVYVAIPMGIRHLDIIVEKMQALSAKLPPPDCDSGATNGCSSPRY